MISLNVILAISTLWFCSSTTQCFQLLALLISYIFVTLLCLIQPLIQSLLKPSRWKKIFLHFLMNSNNRPLSLSLIIIGLNIASQALLLSGTFSSSVHLGLYWFSCISGSSISFVMVYIKVKCKDLVLVFWFYYGAIVVLSSILSFSSQDDQQYFQYYMAWTYLLFSFKMYMSRDFPFFLIQFILFIILITQLLILIITYNSLMEIKSIIEIVYISLVIGWQVTQVIKLYKSITSWDTRERPQNFLFFIENSKLSNIQQSIDCAVCYQDNSSQRLKLELVCGHIFHQQCIQNWIRINQSCPVCRYQVELHQVQIDV